jgi:hypothetical protein
MLGSAGALGSAGTVGSAGAFGSAGTVGSAGAVEVVSTADGSYPPVLDVSTPAELVSGT